MKYKRDYSLTVTVGGKSFEIVPPLAIAFEATKSVFGQANKCTIDIFNLGETKRSLLSFEPEDKPSARMSLSIGYDGNLLGLFRGTIWRAKSKAAGGGYVTTLESIDGGQDYFNAVTSKTVEGGSVIRALNADMPNTALGSTIEEPVLVRPKVLVGSTSRLIEETLGPNQSTFIDDERLYTIDTQSYLAGRAVEVSAGTGLMTTPERSKGVVTFTSIINPLLRVGTRCEIISTTATSLNGVYRLDTAKYKGQTYGAEWSQECQTRYASGMRQI